MKAWRRSAGELGFLLLILLALYPHGALAHGTGHRVMEDSKAVAVEFFYSDGQPMQYAAILVFGPQDDEVEYQNGRTDREGRFAFYPTAAGDWRIEVDDGMGHKEVGIIQIRQEVSEAGAPGELRFVHAHRHDHSTLLRMVAGLSLILNFFLVFYFWKVRAAARQGGE